MIVCYTEIKCVLILITNPNNLFIEKNINILYLPVIKVHTIENKMILIDTMLGQLFQPYYIVNNAFMAHFCYDQFNMIMVYFSYSYFELKIYYYENILPVPNPVCSHFNQLNVHKSTLDFKC